MPSADHAPPHRTEHLFPHERQNADAWPTLIYLRHTCPPSPPTPLSYRLQPSPKTPKGRAKKSWNKKKRVSSSSSHSEISPRRGDKIIKQTKTNAPKPPPPPTSPSQPTGQKRHAMRTLSPTASAQHGNPETEKSTHTHLVHVKILDVLPPEVDAAVKVVRRRYLLVPLQSPLRSPALHCVAESRSSGSSGSKEAVRGNGKQGG